jgi:hypothetical protein
LFWPDETAVRILIRKARMTADALELQEIQRRLASHESERKRLPPSRRRAELDRLIAADLGDLCEWYRRRARHAA